MIANQFNYLMFYLDHHSKIMSEKDHQRLKKRFLSTPPRTLEHGEKSVDRAVKKFRGY